MGNLDVRYVVTVSKMLAADVPSTWLTFEADSRRSMHLSCGRIRSGSLRNRGIGGKRDESKQVSYGIVPYGVSGCGAGVCTNGRQTQGAAKTCGGAPSSGALTIERHLAAN